MLHTAITTAWAHKRRFVGTALSVVLGVAFLTATLVLGDSARAGFRNVFTEANAGTDALVRNEVRITGSEDTATAPLDAAVVDLVASVDGVAAAAPLVEGQAQIVGADGRPVGGGGPPTSGVGWVDDPALNPYRIVAGRKPTAPGEVVIDRGSAEDGALAVGDATTVLTPSPVPVEVVGIAMFGDENSVGGVTLAAFTLDESQRLLLGGRQQVTGVAVGAADAIGQDDLVRRLTAVLPDGVEAISGTDLTAEQQADIEGDFLGFLTTALLAFAVVALLVAAFSIFNTFSILGAQRVRSSALLRALGASRRQVMGSAVAEAALVGVVGAAIGIGGGILAAFGLLALLNAVDFGLPSGGLRIDAGTVSTSVLVGVAVTLAAGAVPAWRSSRVAPLAALREVAVDTGGSSRWRLALGTLLGGGGVAVVLTASADGAVARTGLGALALVVALVLLGPHVARPVGAVLGAPLALRGVAGDLARRNAVRNPRRTSATATALLVGVGIVTLFTVIGASVSATIEDAVDERFGGDLVIESTGFSGPGLGPDLIDGLRQRPEVDTAAGLGWGAAVLDGEDREVGYADVSALDALTDLGEVDGDLSTVGRSQLAVSNQLADAKGWVVGDRVGVGFVDGVSEELSIAVVYDDRMLGGDVLLPVELWAAHTAQPSYAMVMVGLAEGVELEDGRRAVSAVTERFGNPAVRDRDQFVESEAAEVRTLLSVIYGLLAVAILIALMGIANTLSLAIHERTRELGLLRAVGQRRSQMRAMIRWESVLVATFGAVGGVGLGAFLGWGLVRALTVSEGTGTFALPVAPLATVVVVGAAVGVVAGARPAWRASKMDVLTAVGSS